MYNSDKPIENFSDDIFGRAVFAKQLGRAILAFDSKDTFTIGLYGKWGSGKTSIINMALKEIQNAEKNTPNENIPIIVKFEPWNFSDTNQLISQFFKHLRNSMNIKEKGGISEKVGQALEEYAEAFDYIEFIPGVGNLAKILKLTSTYTGKQLQGSTNNGDILRLKENLVRHLEKQEKKILVVIDDIDRLSNEQIKLVFQLVNSVAGLPNIMYLLSMDREIVIRALESVQNCRGEEYLEKIIQLPFDIPQIDREKIFEVFLSRLNSILRNKPEVEVDKSHWEKVFRGCIEPFVKNIRDVNRIINAFQFKYDLVYQEVNFADMIGLTTLQVLVPNSVGWIYNNGDGICGGTSDYVGVSANEQNKRKEEYLKLFKNMYDAPPECILNAISTLFPKIDKEVSIIHENASEEKLRYEQRIASPQKFQTYFNLDISKINISRELMNKSIYTLSYNEIDEIIDQLNKSGKIISYLEELRCYIKDIPTERIPMFVKILYKHRNTMEVNKPSNFLTFSAKQYCDWCLQPMMNRIESKEERFGVYKDILMNASLDVLQTIAVEINRIELGFGRLAATGKGVNEGRQVITIEQLLELEKLFVNQIKTLNTKDTILNCDSLLMIIYLWQYFDKDGCNKYMRMVLKDKMNKLRFIARQSTEWNGTNGRGWSFEKDNYETYVSSEEILSTINELKNTEEFMRLSKMEQLKLATFVLNSSKKSFDHASEDEALKLVIQWNAERITCTQT